MEWNRTEQNRTEQNRTEQNRTEQNRTKVEITIVNCRNSMYYKQITDVWNFIPDMSLVRYPASASSHSHEGPKLETSVTGLYTHM